MYRREEEKDIGPLLAELSSQTSTLVKDEIELAKVELNQKIDRAEKGAISLAAGGAVLYAGILVLLSAVVFLLSAVMPLWLAAFIVGVATVIAGVFALQKGRTDLKAESLKPNRFIDSLRGHRTLAKEHA